MVKKILTLVFVSALLFGGFASFTLAEQPSNHGATVSQVAQDTPPGPGHGQIVSEVARANSNKNHALGFDGRNDFCLIPDSNSLNPANLTIETWIKRTGGINPYKTYDAHCIVSKWNDNNMEASYIFKDWNLDDSRLAFSTNGWSQNYFVLVSNSEITLDKWTFVAATYDNNIAKIFINGQLDAIVFSNGPINGSSADMVLGSVFTHGWMDEFFYGEIDEVRIWDRALTQQEIQANMYRELKTPQPGLVGYWRFNEGSGTVARDSSGNGNNGTIYGAQWVEGAPINK